MRKGHSWRANLTKDLEAQAADYGSLPMPASQILDVELVLTLLHDHLPGEDPRRAWTILNGHPFPARTRLPLIARRAIALVRLRLPRLLSRSSWERRLRQYTELRHPLPCYRLNNTSIVVENTSLLPERRSHMQAALSTSVPWERQRARYAPAGRYRFTIDREMHVVGIPSINPSANSRVLPPPAAARLPLEVTLAELAETARWMDMVAREDPRGKVARQKWEGRIRDLELRLVRDGELIRGETLAVDGILHLLGMVGSGKSSLITVLAVWLARRGQRVTLVQADVAGMLAQQEIFAVFASADARVRALPIIGRSSRKNHLNRLHAARARSLGQPNESDVAQPFDQAMQIGQLLSDKHPGYDLLSTVCALDGLRRDERPIPLGQEPCTRLYAITEKEDDEEEGVAVDTSPQRFDCPFMPICPVHRGTRDLLMTNIWLATPASLLVSSPQLPLVEENLRVIELVMRSCDVVLVDEADLVQVQFDDRFAQIETLLGTSSALLDRLIHQVDGQIYRPGRPDIGRHRAVNRWLAAHRTTQQAADHFLVLLREHGTLRDWLKGVTYFTGLRLFQHVAVDLRAAKLPDKPLMDAAERFELNPPTSVRVRYAESEVPAAWRHALAAELQNTDTQGALEQLSTWLLEAIPIAQNLGPQMRGRICLRLLLSLVVGVLDHAIQDLVAEWTAAEEVLELDRGTGSLFYGPSSDLARLIPESPTGAVLGFHYYDPDDTGNGELRFLHLVGMGRSLLSHLHDALRDTDGIVGPHVVLTSGTSYAPGSWRYHLHIPPGAVLLTARREQGGKIECFFSPLADPDRPSQRIYISGRKPGPDRHASLRAMVAALAERGWDGRSIFDQEFEILAAKTPHRQNILLVVGSYDEARLVGDMLSDVLGAEPGIQVDVVIGEVDGDHPAPAPGRLQRSLLSEFGRRPARFLVAPLQTIERGHNILSQEVPQEAALGSVFFLVRPQPVPGDPNAAVQRLNAWAELRVPQLEGAITAAGQQLRDEADAKWRTELSGTDRPSGDALLWTELVMIWQCIGRLLRGGGSARVHFVDGAWAKVAAGLSPEPFETDETSMLLGFERILTEASEESTPADRDITAALYGLFLPALRAIPEVHRG